MTGNLLVNCIPIPHTVPPLISCHTSSELDWSSIHSVVTHSAIQSLLEKHSSLFREDLGTLKGTKAKIHVPSNVQPRFFKQRPLPFKYKDKVEKKLERLENAGVISLVQFSEWAAPILPVIKPDGGVHICGDYSVTVNAVTRFPELRSYLPLCLEACTSPSWTSPMHTCN